MSAAPTTAAPAMIPPIAPPERPLFVTAAAFVGGGDIDVGDVDVDTVGGVTMDKDCVGAVSDCAPVESAMDEVDGVVAEEGAEGEDRVAEEEVRALLEEGIADVAVEGVWLDIVVVPCWVAVVVPFPLPASASIGKAAPEPV